MKNYFKHKLENLIVIKKIVTIHYFEFDKHFATPGETHDFWEMVYADKASLLCTADGREIRLNEGEILFHKPNEYHTLAANGQKAPNVFIASFECASQSIRFFEGRKIAVDPALRPFIYAIIEEARKTFCIPFSNPQTKKMEIQAHPVLGGQQLIKNYLEILLISLMRSVSEQEQQEHFFLESKELGNRIMNEVTHYLQENIHKKLTISNICAQIGYSRTTVFRLFREHTGQTPMEYFIQLKIQGAKRLLRESDLSVMEISYRLGFDSANYFTKVFKRYTGLTPSAYKKRIRFLN